MWGNIYLAVALDDHRDYEDSVPGDQQRTGRRWGCRCQEDDLDGLVVHAAFGEFLQVGVGKLAQELVVDAGVEFQVHIVDLRVEFAENLEVIAADEGVVGELDAVPKTADSEMRLGSDLLVLASFETIV